MFFVSLLADGTLRNSNVKRGWCRFSRPPAFSAIRHPSASRCNDSNLNDHCDSTKERPLHYASCDVGSIFNSFSNGNGLRSSHSIKCYTLNLEKRLCNVMIYSSTSVTYFHHFTQRQHLSHTNSRLLPQRDELSVMCILPETKKCGKLQISCDHVTRREHRGSRKMLSMSGMVET